MIKTSKQRAYLKSLAQNENAIFQIGKSTVTPEVTESVLECFNNRELIKITVLKNCEMAPVEAASIIAERTGSEVVQVIGRKIVLYKENKDNPVIKLPK